MSPLPISGLGVSAALTETFNLTGKLPLQLDETVVPVVNVADLADEIWGPTAYGTIAVAAAPGFRSEIEIAVPVLASGQGAAAIIDSVELVGTGAAVTFLQIAASPGMPAPTIAGFTDWADNGVIGAPMVEVNGKNDAAAAVGFAATLGYYLVLYEVITLPLRWILREFQPTGVQQGLMIRPFADDQEVRANFRWRERLPR